MYLVWSMKEYIHIEFCSRHLSETQKYIGDDKYLVVYCEER